LPEGTYFRRDAQSPKKKMFLAEVFCKKRNRNKKKRDAFESEHSAILLSSILCGMGKKEIQTCTVYGVACRQTQKNKLCLPSCC